LNGLLAWRKPFSRRAYKTHEDKNFRYLYETDPSCNGIYFGPLWFLLRQVSLCNMLLYVTQICVNIQGKVLIVTRMRG